MKKIAIIGAGISGLTSAHMLKKDYDVTVYEKEKTPGGLIRCKRIDGSLFHTCGGHVFNTKRNDVLSWFWSNFEKEEEFIKTDRNSCVFIDKNGTSLEYEAIPYPIENHMYFFSKKIQSAFYEDLKEIDKVKGINAKLTDYENFGDFLRWRFGKTLYNLYFQPYNKKVWRRDLTKIPMSWMDGKLPMPTTEEMRINNSEKVEEKKFVHSTFWYEKIDGSQYIAEKLAQGLDIRYNVDVTAIEYVNERWILCGEEYDRIVFCGNIKDIVTIIKGVNFDKFRKPINELEYHGTTAVFCEFDANPYSWIYQPSTRHDSHRIICTGNFSKTNNGPEIPEGRITGTIEFTDEINKEAIIENLKCIPLNPKYIDHQYNKFSYPIQNNDTRTLIKDIKSALSPYGFYFTGRFADWEYYNMDVAMGAAIDLCKYII